ncbi:MAG: colanic acid biosynthesis glycosyltransferase WcaL [Bacteroidia bacterium]|nr:colanic acid biosynthesis glycosyltransferase WcaL [Bacteroidia bacterium]
MKIAYLVNQYPSVSHTFIRREILELERRGHELIRLTIRNSKTPLVDPLDLDELLRTQALLDSSFLSLLSALVRAVILRPVGFFRAFSMMWRLNRASNRGFLRHLAYLVEAILLSDICKNYQVLHVHTHFGTNSASVTLLAKILSGLTYSLTIHGPEEFDAPVALSLRQKVKEASFVLVISHYGKCQLHRWTDSEDWIKIYIVRCTVDDDFFLEAQPVPKNAVALVCVGRLSAQKGQLVLLEAFGRALKNGRKIKLILAGDGEMRQTIEKTIQKHQLNEHVEITGWISGERVRELLRNSCGLVLPSFAEGLPVVIMEAMAMGRPVISTFVAGIPELVRDGVNGWLVPAGDVDALVDAIVKLTDTPPEQLTAMGKRGTEAVRANHQLQAEIDKLEQYLMGFC